MQTARAEPGEGAGQSGGRVKEGAAGGVVPAVPERVAPTKARGLPFQRGSCPVGLLSTPCDAGMNAPAQHVADAWQSAEFYANKVLMEHRGSSRWRLRALETHSQCLSLLE